MGKKFNSLSEIKKYIKAGHRQCAKEIGQEVENVMKETTQRNLYNSYDPDRYIRTYGMIEMIRTTRSDENSVLVEFQDVGGHTSWKKPHPHVYIAPILEEGGHTWERDGGRKSPTNIIKDSVEEVRHVAPNTYIRVMGGRGVKVRRK